MSKTPEFIVVAVLHSNNKNETTVRKETLAVNNIEKIRNWHNKGNNGIEKTLPMVQMHLKKEISFSDSDDIKDATKVLLLQENFDTLNEKIGAVVITN